LFVKGLEPAHAAPWQEVIREQEREASWSAVAEMPGPPGIGDTDVERRKNALRTKSTLRHTKAVSR